VQVAPALSAQLPAGMVRPDALILWLSIAAIALATINMFGGFAVTQRMLAMFRK
jgi:NAD(P) transhydrogenase subunit alpha